MSQLDLIGGGLSTYTGARDALDRYYTPAPITDALMARLHPILPEAERVEVLEPCAGRQLAIAGVVRSWSPRYRVWTADLDPGAPADQHGDALEQDWTEVNGGRPWDLALTNPPFALAAPLIAHLTHHARCVVCLARLSLLEPVEDRAGLLTGRELPGSCQLAPGWGLARVIVTPRQRFRGGPPGSTQQDSVTTAWFVWTPGRRAPAGLEIITRREEEHWQIARAEGRIPGAPYTPTLSTASAQETTCSD